MVLALTALLATAIVTDLRSSRIPNWLTVPAMIFGIAAHGWHHGLHGLLFGIFGLCSGLGLFLLLHLAGCIGAGDVKLMAAVGAMVGPQDALLSALLAMMFGGLYALGAMIHQWGFVSAMSRLGSLVEVLALTRGRTSWRQELRLPFRLRYGLPIAGGTLLLQLGIRPFGE